MTRADWDAHWERQYASALREKNEPFWAFKRAHEIMEKTFGPRPPKDQVAAPGLVAWMRLGLQLKGFKMKTSTNINAWLAAAAAAFTTASAQFALANGDMVVTGGEWAGIAIQFISVFLGTITRFDAPKPKE